MPDHRADDNNHVGQPPLARRARRVSTDAPAGSDPTPVQEPGRHQADENDEHLKRDKPPHWG